MDEGFKEILSKLKGVTDLIQASVDAGITTVEEIHKSLVGENIHNIVSGSIYDVIRSVNTSVGKFATDMIEIIEEYDENLVSPQNQTEAKSQPTVSTPSQTSKNKKDTEEIQPKTVAKPESTKTTPLKIPKKAANKKPAVKSKKETPSTPKATTEKTEGQPPKKVSSKWYVYIIECMDNTLYTGITTNVEERFQQHKAKTGSKYVAQHGAKQVVWSQECEDRSEASKREYVIKKLSKARKLELIASKK